MAATAHIDFIAAAYAAAVIVIGALVVWVIADYRAQGQKIAELEKRGVTRRSAGERPPRQPGQADRAKEQA
ncbi:MAG TPA: heme exporter protein CcmD [Xanthobacteraceae bacterium]|nr:heme exporter protein CcmD [Xanthobacteraceae bacterium]